MKKNLLIAAIAITALASCSSNDFVGDESPQTSSGTNGAISFTSGIPAVTRTSGAIAAASLNNNFVVFGYKTVNSTPQKVFDNYQVNYVTSSENTTTSNSAGWEYVGYKNLPGGITTNVGVTAFAALTGSGQANESAIDQSIKYWDFAATSYDFFAYSLGDGINSNWARASALNMTGYTLTGSQAELGACYISKKRHIDSPSSPVTAVDLTFVNFLSKIQLKFFETIPGYAVKDLKFYSAVSTYTDSDNSGDTDGKVPALYGADNSIKSGGQFTITFDTNNNPIVTFTSDAGYTQQSNIKFDEISSGVWLDHYATTLDYHEAASAGDFLAREASAATSTSQISVFPNSTGVALTLKMDYTLVSRDGTGETLQVTGATATIPAVYTAWKPNYAYTYIFKITDDKLIPITLDAIVTDTQDGSQETITTVSTPSITTYAKASNVTTDNEYKKTSNIYVVVDKSGTIQTLTSSNAKLYLVTNNTGTGTEQLITEASVANALANGTPSDGSEPTDGVNDTWTVTGAGMKNLIVTSLGVPTLEATSSIVADDSPTGVAITVDGAKFTPTAAGTYVFEYTDTSDSKKYYKIIKVVD